MIEAATQKLTYLDISFNPSKEINNQLMTKIGMCLSLQTLILTGCEYLGDEGMNNIFKGDIVKGKPVEGLQHLKVLKVGGLVNVGDKIYQLLKRCPSLHFVELNNLQSLTQHFLDQIKSLTYLRTVHINFTPNITDEKIKQVRETAKHLNIVRNITKMTDPNDDGLRMPIPLASMKIKKPKKKKK